jgi:hypothetical protein
MALSTCLNWFGNFFLTFAVVTLASCGGSSTPSLVPIATVQAPETVTKSTCNINLESFKKISRPNLSKLEINTILGCEGEVSIDVPTRYTSTIVYLPPPTYIHAWTGPVNADGTPGGSIRFTGPVPDTKEIFYQSSGQFSYFPLNQENAVFSNTGMSLKD